MQNSNPITDVFYSLFWVNRSPVTNLNKPHLPICLDFVLRLGNFHLVLLPVKIFKIASEVTYFELYALRVSKYRLNTYGYHSVFGC